jgi:predicted metal-dependent hydrolase
MAREHCLELASEEEVDADEQYRRHGTQERNNGGRATQHPPRTVTVSTPFRHTPVRAFPIGSIAGRRPAAQGKNTAEVDENERTAESIDAWFSAGLDLMRRREFFAAHEELELAWRAAQRDERDFFQGLVHVTVAWYQAGRGNRVGCERQLAKATRRLGPYAPSHRSVDVAAVLAQVADARRTVAGGSLALPPPRI